jgi:hypothetical protein
MKIDNILGEWKTDQEWSGDFTKDIRQIPKLHNKYYVIYLQEKGRLKQYIQSHEKLLLDAQRYYSKDEKLDPDIIKQRGWPDIIPQYILKTSVADYIKADDIVQKSSMQIFLQEEKIDLLKEILEQIKWRNNLIKNMIDNEKFKSGI